MPQADVSKNAIARESQRAIVVSQRANGLRDRVERRGVPRRGRGSCNYAEDTVPHQRITPKRPGRVTDSSIRPTHAACRVVTSIG